MLSSFRIRIGNISPSATQWRFPLWKWGTNPQNLPFPLYDVDPRLIQQCLGPPHALPQTAAPTVESLSHTYVIKSPLVTPKSTPSRGPIPKPHYLPHPWTRPTYDANWACGSDPPFFHNALNRPTYGQTDGPTDRPRESLMTIARYASAESDAA